MTRGNQRELDRAKNLKKQQGQKKTREVGEGGGSLQTIKLQCALPSRTQPAQP